MGIHLGHLTRREGPGDKRWRADRRPQAAVNQASRCPCAGADGPLFLGTTFRACGLLVSGAEPRGPCGLSLSKVEVSGGERYRETV